MNYMGTPYKIIINEAVNMAKKYGEDNSPSFVNGVLAKIVAENKLSDKKNTETDVSTDNNDVNSEQ